AAIVILVLMVTFAATSLFAAEEDSIAAIFVFGRTGGWTTSGFSVGDGSYIVTSADALTETLPGGKTVPIRYAAVASRWTGDAYIGTVVATDPKARIALIKLPVPAIPPVAIAGDDALSRVKKATLGQLLSGDEVGAKFPTTLYGLKIERDPTRFTVGKWKGTNACISEVKDINWLFLTKLDPEDGTPKAALVSKPGLGALGIFFSKLTLENGQQPVVFHQVLPCTALRATLVKAGVPADKLSQPPSLDGPAKDAETAFQLISIALATSRTAHPSALTMAEAAVRARPDNAIAHLLAATAQASQGKHEDAIKSINKALELDPKIPDGTLQKGRILAAAGKLDEAEKELRKALEADPKDTRPMLDLVAILIDKEGKLDEALKLAKDVTKLTPEDLGGRIALARVLKKKKDYDEAEAELKAILEIAPKLGEARVGLAATYEAAGKKDEAEAQYLLLVEQEPENPGAHLLLIDFLIRSDKKDEARKAIEKARELKLQPEALEALKKLEEGLGEAEKQDS
ncbi:MAG TPA: tetratricopeptide repeat protein, partial [Armatimonadota bacterium]|nr:tetratricopeptide repeat protein [Armatimonadota bacterium]